MLVTWGSVQLSIHCSAERFTIMPSENWWCWVGAGGRSPGLKWDGAPLSACLTLVLFPSKPGSVIKSLHYLAINEVNFLSQNCLAHAALIPGKHCNTTITWAKKELMENKTVERNVLLGKLSPGHGQWSHPQKWITCSSSHNGREMCSFKDVLCPIM